jgi:multidrug transporter EmrE-like cation transporter
MNMHWIYLVAAVAGNVMANISFKTLMSKRTEAGAESNLAQMLLEPSLWFALTGCVFLLGCYLLALRAIGLATAYATVTSLSLVLTSALSAFFLGEKFPAAKVAGMSMILVGVLFVVKSEIS